MCIYIYICYHENNVPSQLSPQYSVITALQRYTTKALYIICSSDLHTAFIFLFFQNFYILHFSQQRKVTRQQNMMVTLYFAIYFCPTLIFTKQKTEH